jgi:hypothetical protein
MTDLRVAGLNHDKPLWFSAVNAEVIRDSLFFLLFFLPYELHHALY